ncbi:MAG: aminotransferase class V-fold PLP-dependent enzyme [Pseudanabaenaceae cyanobacterium SKYGB_i_bin29]|nr:aminotransferase class V-fold PLP-dependent enzyme [Pseudanabaenaceae cyanobacterium SKYG29]MDW8421162.1 aminotransferase class V-fold PLP-dependent enzyme [Pseudanabaenaceae cyanobacterium SKYGB_i_bin29]
MFGARVRSLWALAPDCIFLNHGSFGATPIPVLQAQSHWQREIEGQPVAFLVKELLPHLDRSRLALAEFIQDDPHNLVFVDNATTGINTVLRSLCWQPGDKVLTTNHVYGAVRQALQFISDRYGVEIIFAPVPFPCQDILSVLLPWITADLKLIVIDHITSPTALVFPIAAIIAHAHSQGVPVLVDGAHAPGMVDLNLQQLGADWYVGNCHKWLCSAKGCAFISTQPQWQEFTHPLTISHGYQKGYQQEFNWMGTRDFSSWLALPEAIGFLQSLGLSHSRNYNRDLIYQGGNILAAALGTTMTSRPEIFMLTLPLPDRWQSYSPQELHDWLWQSHRIEVPVIAWENRLYIRISAQVYNEPRDYETLAQVLQSKL